MEPLKFDFILTVLTPLGLRLLPPRFGVTGLLEIAASGTGLEQTCDKLK